MKAHALRRHIRLLPTVMALMGTLLLVKGWGLAVGEQALASASTQSTRPAPATTRENGQDPEADGSAPPSASTVDVMTNLSKRRAELDARDQDLVMRNNLIAAAAKRVDQKIADLKDLQAKIEALLGQRDAAEQKQIDAIVKSYSSMKPKDAARIFNGLSEDVLIPVTAAMKPDVLGAILAQMQPEDAQKLTVKLANRLRVRIEAPTQVAASAPPGAATTSVPQPVPAAQIQSPPGKPAPQLTSGTSPADGAASQQESASSPSALTGASAPATKK